MDYKPNNKSHLYVGYNPYNLLTNLLLSSWDIQAGSKFPKHRDPLGHAIFTQRAHWRVFQRQIQRRAVGPSFPDGKGLAGCNGENTNKKHIECPLPSQKWIHFYQKYNQHQPNIKIQFSGSTGSFCFRILKIHHLMASYPEDMGVIPSFRTRNLTSDWEGGCFKTPNK